MNQAMNLAIMTMNIAATISHTMVNTKQEFLMSLTSLGRILMLSS